MLLAIREKVQGWIAWAIVIILIVPFALWGIDQYATGDKTVVVAEVNGEAISANQFLQMYNRQRMRLQQQFGDLYDQVVEDQQLREQVLDALIESQLIRQWANEHGLLISDQQLSAMIQAADVFKENGEFSEQVYQDVLLRNGLSVSSFEFEQRQFLIENQYRNLTASSMWVMPGELETLYQLQNQRRNIDYIRLDQRVFRDQVKVTDEQMQAYYDANKDDYIVPEQVVVDYLVLSRETLAEQIEVTDEQAQNFYQNNLGLFTQPEMRRARHILIQGDTDESQQKIADIQAQLAEGADFAELAKNYSEDPGSAPNGGDLDYFEQGMMVPEFDQVVFAMEIDQISDVVKTDFGLHLIQLTDIREQEALPYDQVKDDVKAQMRQDQSQQIYYEKLEALNTLAYEQPDSLEPLLSIVDAKIQTSEPFSREGADAGLMSNPKIVDATFSDDVFKSRLNSSVIEVNEDTSVVLRVKDYSPEKLQTFDEVKAQIKDSLVRQESIEQAAKLADQVMAKIEQGASPKSLVKSGVEWHKVGWIERQNQQVLPQITQTAFKIAKPQDEQANWGRVQLITGDTVLVRLNKVDVIEDEQTRSQMGQLEDALLSVLQNSELEARLTTLKADAKIEKRSVYETVK
jgi:peptidyl-prolyl cis-trans isomerase D